MKTKITPRHPLAVLAVLAMVFVSGMATTAGDGVITQTATGSYEQIVTGLKKAITANKLVIVKEVPFTQMLAMVGVKVKKIPTKVSKK